MEKLLCILLITCLMLTILPTTVLAAAPENANYNDADVTWLGTTSEYQKTLKVFFDSGLRKVAVGDKYGLVDQYGAYAAQPYMVYDQLSKKRLRMITDTGGEIIYKSHLESGIVGPKGIIVPAQYHGGIWGNSAIGWYPPGAQIKIILNFPWPTIYNQWNKNC